MTRKAFNVWFAIAMAVFGLAATASAQQKAETWRVAYDADGSEFRRSLAGVLELRDGQLRFTADNGSAAWRIALADLRLIAPSQGYGADSNAVVIESLAGERVYVAVVNKHFLFANPKKAVQTVNAAMRLPAIRAARAVQERRVAAAADDADSDGDAKEKGGAV